MSAMSVGAMSVGTAGSAARTLAMPLRSPLAKAAPKKATALRLVPQRRSSAAKAPFVVVVVMLLVGGLLGLLLLNTLVAQDSFTLHDLNKNAKALQQQEQDLARQVQALQSPAELAAQATHFGMVAGGPPAFLRLTDGKVLGQPTAGVAPVPVTPVPPVTPAAATAKTPAGSTTWTGPRQSPPPTAHAATTRPTGPTGPTGPTRTTTKKPATSSTGAHQ